MARKRKETNYNEDSDNEEVDLKKMHFDKDNEETQVIDTKGKVNYSTEDGTTIQISFNRRVSIKKWKEMIMVDIRETYKDPSGNDRPGKKGISLKLDQWEQFKKNIELIDKELKKLQGEE